MKETFAATEEGDATELSQRYATSDLSPIQALSACLARVETVDAKLNAFLFLAADAARNAAEQSAERWRTGCPLSALDGVPIGIKANIAVWGWPWHAGVAAYRDRISTRDATCVASLRAAGAVLLGSLNMDEAALGATGDNLAFGRCRNPHDLSRSPGGSSGGPAAAVAAKLCYAALGTDTMGSVRIPASYCGAVGHKPRLAAIPTIGVTPLSWTLDTVGVIARSARDVDAMMSLLDPTHRLAVFGEERLDGLQIAALDLSNQITVEDGVQDAFVATLTRAHDLGAEVEAIRLEDYDVAAVRRAALLVAEVEGLVEHQAMLAERPEGFTSALSAMFAWAARQSAPKLASAYRLLAAVGRQVREAASAYDAILTPTTPQVAFALDAAVPADQADFTLLGNVSGLPATAFPIGSTSAGLPLSVQVIAAGDAMALRLAAALARRVTAPSLTAER